MAEGDGLPLHDVDPHRRRVEQQVDDVIVQQVDLVHVEDAPVGRCEHAWIELPLPLLDGALDIQRAHDAVLRRADGEVDEARAMAGAGQLLAGLGPLATLGAPRRRLVWIAAKVAVGDHLDLGQQGGQRAGGGRFGRAALATDEHPADLGVDGVQYQRALQALLSNDGSKWKDWHSPPPR